MTLVMIGTLPTLRPEHFDAKWLSDGARYTQLNTELFAARGEDMLLNLEGAPGPTGAVDRLTTRVGSIMPESVCTSVQLHIQTAPEDFGAYWNAAQCLAGVQVAVGANSAFLLGKALWHETRIPLFPALRTVLPAMASPRASSEKIAAPAAPSTVLRVTSPSIASSRTP